MGYILLFIPLSLLIASVIIGPFEVGNQTYQWLDEKTKEASAYKSDKSHEFLEAAKRDMVDGILTYSEYSRLRKMYEPLEREIHKKNLEMNLHGGDRRRDDDNKS